MNKFLRVPFLGVNDVDCKVVIYESKSGEFVKNNQLIFSLETSKTNYDIFAESEGYLFYDVSEGQTVKVEELLAIISDDKNLNYKKELQIFSTQFN